MGQNIAVQATIVNKSHTNVVASDAEQVLGATGQTGETLASLTIVPLTTSPGQVGLRDGFGTTEIILFEGGATSVADLKPFTIPLNARSLNGGWYVTTGANVTVLAVGNFT